MMFSPALRQAWQPSDGSWRTEIPPGWSQGRAVFGGVLAAAAISLAKRNSDTQWSVRSFHLRFFRPATAGELFGEYRVQRQGKGTNFVEVLLKQANQTVASASLTLANHRDGSVVIDAPPPPQLKPVNELVEMPYLAGLTPEFTPAHRVSMGRRRLTVLVS